MNSLLQTDRDDYCIRPPQDCSHIASNLSYSTFSVGPAPCYVSIVSDVLSCIASLSMMGIYAAWADIRQNIAQSIITFIAIADFLTAGGYLAADVNLLAFVFSERNPGRQGCEIFTSTCEIQSYIITYATMSSYFWTIILALHFYVTFAQGRPTFTKKLIPLFHLIGWGIPILIVFPLLCAGKLAYAPFVTGMWCYIEIYRDSPPFSNSNMGISVITQLPEIIAFLLIIIFFILTWIKIRKQVSNCYN